MVGFAIWIVGLVLTIKAALEIWRIHAPIERRLIAIILIVLTSWIGLLFYYFYGKARMPAGYWSSKILATSESNIYMNIILNMGEYSKSQQQLSQNFPPSRRRFELLLTFTLCKLPIFFNSLITENPTAFIIYTLQLLADNLCSNHTKGYAVATISQIKKHPVLIWTITDKG